MRSGGRQRPLQPGKRDNYRMSASALHARLRLYLDLIRWNRPAGTYLLLWPTLSALWIAAGGFPGWHLVAVFTSGRS